MSSPTIILILLITVRPFFRVMGEVIVGEQSSPCSRDGSIYEDMGFDGMVSEEGDGAPPSA